MFAFPISRRRSARLTARRPQVRRHPLVEDLEGRQLLSSGGAGAATADITVTKTTDVARPGDRGDSIAPFQRHATGLVVAHDGVRADYGHDHAIRM